MADTSLIECPGCHQAGNVNRSVKSQKYGYSIGKIFLAIFTIGISLLFGVGVSRKRRVTTFKCKNCRNEWTA